MAWLRKRKRSKRALYWIERRKVKGKLATRKPNIIDDLPESLLLLEIFSKLRNPKHLIVCKSVSKRWNSLISSSSFLHNPSLALILNTEPPCATNDVCLEGWKGFELSNYVHPEIDSPICVLASCKDVLLCMKSSAKEFYIVNPVTMQWTRLPESGTVTSRLPFGLIGNGTKGLYHVVKLLSSTSSSFILFVFDSMLGTWRGTRVNHPPWSESGWCPTQYQALVFKGALHWLAEDGPVVAYNPNDQKTCLFIHRSQEMRHAYYGGDAVVSETLTISMGHLRILQLVAAAGHRHLSIWTLVDYRQSIWKQEHDPISFTDLPWLQDWRTSSTQHNTSLLLFGFRRNRKTRERILSPQPLCCHPYNLLLVYFCLSESIVSLDVATKKLQLITRLSKRGTDGVYWNQYDRVIPMTMHLDPSLVPDHGHVLRPRRKHRFFRV